MNVEGSSPNMLGGVSRQPSEIRFPAQLEESVNQFPTASRGLTPRNPALFMSKVNNVRVDNSHIHLINRDKRERYTAFISKEGIKVYDLEGRSYKVNAPQGYGYLDSQSPSDLEALTVADHTFILNKTRVVRTLSEKTPPLSKTALIHVVQGEYHTEYRVYVNDYSYTYETSGGPYEDAKKAIEGEESIRPSKITYWLMIALMRGAHAFTTERFDNVLAVWRKDGEDFTVSTEGATETKFRAHKGVTQKYEELPRRAPNGFSIKVAGSKDSDYDDYYVIFDHPKGAALGRWKETVGGDIPYKLDPSTMPHLLVREADGSFTFKPADWEPRRAGDLKTNPWPSFVDNTIGGLVFLKNRLGFFSKEAVTLSRHESYFDFFNESARTSLDTDPIDVSIAYAGIADIQQAVPFANGCLLFTSSIPFMLGSGTEPLTPSTARIQPLFANQSSALVTPLCLGTKLYFVNDLPSGSFVYEFAYDLESGAGLASSITDHVQGYIPRNVFLLEGHEDLKLLALVSQEEPRAIYIYKWLWIGQEKVQSAWQKWTINAPIIALKFFDEDLVLVTKQGNGIELLKINCHETWTDKRPFVLRLDRRVEQNGTYDSQGDYTCFELPYQAQDAVAFAAWQDNYGYPLAKVKAQDNRLYLDGNLSGKPVYIGFPYESYGVLSKLHYRSTNNQGGYGNAIAGTNVTLGALTFETSASAGLDVELLRAYRKPYTYRFSAQLSGTKTSTFGHVVLGDIQKPISIMAQSDDVTIKFGHKSPYPYSLLSYRWTGKVFSIIN